METTAEDFFLSMPEPERSAFLFIRQFFKDDMNLPESVKFNTPFYYYKSKWFCYLSYDRKKKDMYIGFVKGFKVSHPKLLSEGRKQVKIYKIFPEKDINVKELQSICKMLKAVYV